MKKDDIGIAAVWVVGFLLLVLFIVWSRSEYAKEEAYEIAHPYHQPEWEIILEGGERLLVTASQCRSSSDKQLSGGIGPLVLIRCHGNDHSVFEGKGVGYRLVKEGWRER